MPKLPTKEQLGSPVFAQREIVPASAVDAGDMGLGDVARSVKSAGAAITAYGQARKDYEDSLDLIRADAYKTRALASLDDALRDNPDYKSHVPFFGKAAGAATEDAAKLIRDPKLRERWKIKADTDAFEVGRRVSSRADGMRREHDLAEVETALGIHKDRYVGTGDEAERAKAKADLEATIAVGERSGLISPSHAMSLRERYLRGAEIDDAAVRLESDPDGLLDDLTGRGFERTLIARESSGDPKAVNEKTGYAGLYQFGAPVLTDLGVYKKGSYEKVGGGKWGGRKWTGEFSIPGFDDVKTIDDFLGNAEAQKAVFELHVKGMDEQIVKYGLDKFEGKTVGGVAITRDALRAMIHLGGAGGAKDFLESDGATDHRDVHGTSIGDYGRMVGPTARYGMLPPEMKAKLARSAASAKDARLEGRREELKRMLADDIESIRRTGTPREGIDLETAAKVLEPNQINTYIANRRRAGMEYEAMLGLESMTGPEIDKRLVELEPKAGEEGYDDRAYVWDKLEKRATEIEKLRLEDPAAAADAVPEVGSAAKAALEAGTPEAVQELVGARLAAQAKFGIEPGARQPITRREAKALFRKLDVLPERDYRLALPGFVEDIENRYGAYAKPVLETVMREAGLQADQAELMASALSRAVRGGKISDYDMRKVEMVGATATGLTMFDERAADAGFMSLYPMQDPVETALAGGPAAVRSPLAPVAVTVRRAGPSPEAIKALKADPTRAGEFDAKFGDGAASRYLTK